MLADLLTQHSASAILMGLGNATCTAHFGSECHVMSVLSGRCCIEASKVRGQNRGDFRANRAWRTLNLQKTCRSFVITSHTRLCKFQPAGTEIAPPVYR